MTRCRSATRRVAGLRLALSILAVSACSRDDQRVGPSPYELVDADGDTIALQEPARRVVSLVPSASETLHALRRDDVLVGRTDFDTASWAAAIPSVGGGLEPSLEAIVALGPDLVIRFAGEQDTRTPARLDGLGIEHMAVRPDRLQDVYRTVELVGRAVGERGRADSLVAEIRGGLAAASARLDGLPPVRVAYLLDGTPPWAAGPDTFVDEILELMGAENVFGDLKALYAPVSPEQLRERTIDVVLLAGAQAFDASLVPGARIERTDGALDLPGPGVVQAAVRIGELLHRRAPR